MEFIDLKKQYRVIEHNLRKRFDDIMNDSRFIMGKEVKEIEEKLANYVGVKHCISCGSGTDALHIPLMALDIGEGDAVFVPTFTFYATAEVVDLVGATPIFVDAEKDTFNIDPNNLELSIQNVIKEGKLQPKAVIPVDMFGLMANYEAIDKICEKYGLYNIQDSAQSYGARFKGTKACAFGNVAATSFFPVKPLGCYGDGGAMFTDSDEMAEAIQSIKIHGRGKDKYDNTRKGMNSRLDTLQAAVLLEKIEIFDDELVARNRSAEQYKKGLQDILEVPLIPQNYYSCWSQYTVLTKDEMERKAIMDALQKKQIPSMIYYATPIHRQAVYANLKRSYSDLSVSEELSRRVLSLPMHGYLEEEEQNIIIQTIRQAIEK